MQESPKENTSDTKKWLSIVAAVLFAMLLILLFMCNRVVTFMQDDLWYSTNLVTGENLSSVGDIVESQIWHYLNWGGRSVAHALLQFLLWKGEVVCNIVNTVVFALLCFFFGKYGKKWDPWKTLLAGGAMVAFNPNILDTLFWQSGTVNYLYMTLLAFPLAGLYLNRLSGVKTKEMFKKKESTDDGKTDASSDAAKDNPALTVLGTIGVFLWGVLSGWTNENMGPTIFLISAAVILVSVIRRIKIKPWMIGGSIGLLAGSAALILSPGNGVRNEDIHTLGSWKLDLCKRVVDYMQGAFVHLLPVLLFVILSYVLYRAVKKEMPDAPVMIILFAGVISYLALVLSPHVPERALFGTMCFFIWGGIKLLSGVGEDIKKERYLIAISLLLFFSAFHKIFFLWAQGVGWYRYS